MPAIVNMALGNWVDNENREAVSFMTTQDQTTGAAAAYAPLANALQDCSDAWLNAIQFQSTLVRVGVPVVGPYGTCIDRASLLGNIIATGAPYRLSIVGPKSSIFLADNSTVDLSNPLIVALQTQVMALMGDNNGNPCGPFKRGVRQMARGN